ncbi:unnamed protein product [Didymodactylos carnosus]|uniref:Uncharacterized protein n=1 Tax=Didymodactylos carnosus TaxID=1234261 RepID=A0A8S2DBZ8_9BILA|nr:unnamed protein product [Didymodactylos carnosus]CAF3642487.1 unnamed protein product [Didymodactylos carnosus]
MPSTSVPSTSVPSTSVPAQAHATAACTMGAFSNVFPAPIISTAAQTGDDLVGTYGVNLIINGDGETGPCETGGGTTHPSFWTYNGTITQVQYGNLQWADQNWTSPGPSNRGNCYFFGGQTWNNTWMTQTINLTAYSTAIDNQNVHYNLSAWLGGWSTDDDSAEVSFEFLDQCYQVLGASAKIGPVTAADRSDITQLLFRQATGTVWIGTREIQLQLKMALTIEESNLIYQPPNIIQQISQAVDHIGVSTSQTCAQFIGAVEEVMPLLDKDGQKLVNEIHGDYLELLMTAQEFLSSTLLLVPRAVKDKNLYVLLSGTLLVVECIGLAGARMIPAVLLTLIGLIGVSKIGEISAITIVSALERKQEVYDKAMKCLEQIQVQLIKLSKDYSQMKGIGKALSHDDNSVQKFMDVLKKTQLEVDKGFEMLQEF